MTEIYVDTSGYASLADVSEPFYEKAKENAVVLSAVSLPVRLSPESTAAGLPASEIRQC
ncbi:MAG: hypothetical protein LH614_03720 [Pyrinomonadaceae bacterium]|nr:hypothetical protein [Pyrinomonadaceae bacterium]